MKHPVVMPHLGATGGDVRILESRVGESAVVAGGSFLMHRARELHIIDEEFAVRRRSRGN
jgi:hypothetical protein